MFDLLKGIVVLGLIIGGIYLLFFATDNLDTILSVAAIASIWRVIMTGGFLGFIVIGLVGVAVIGLFLMIFEGGGLEMIGPIILTLLVAAFFGFIGYTFLKDFLSLVN